MAKILVVDDTPLTHRLLRVMLGRINHTIVNANNGKEALDCLQETAVDLLITDINMPQMDGFTLLEKLRADDLYRHLPVIVMTASGQEQMPRIATEKGANSVITQPISTIELSDAVQKCLQV